MTATTTCPKNAMRSTNWRPLVDRIVKYEPPSSTADRAAKEITGNVTPQGAE
jgi:hypothetical protein